MRSIWTGTLSFGMVVIPVKLASAVSENKTELHQHRRSDGSRIAYKKVAVADGQPVEYSDIVSGYETANGQVVLLERADFEAAFGAKSREAKVIAVTDVSALPRLAHEESYVIQPGNGGDRAYELLAKALTATGKAAVVSFAMRQREAIGLVYASADGYLTLERLQWAANVRTPDFAAPSSGVTDAEVEQAVALIGVLPQGFDWSAARDESEERLQAVIQAKIENGDVTGAPREATSVTCPADFSDLLRQSVQAAKPKPARKPRARKVA